MKTLLLVEDQEFNRSVLARRLRRHGFQVLLAEDGKSCLQKATSLQPQIILLDMNLPDLSGWEVARRLRAQRQCSHIPIIGVSAHVGADAKAQALEAGCQDYETKPIHFPQLLKKIDAWIDKAPALPDA